MKNTGHYFSPARQNVYYGRKLEPTFTSKKSPNLGAQNVLFVTNSSLANTALSASIVEAVKKFGVYQVTGLKAHSPRGDVTRVCNAIEKHSINLVIAFGGGSVCDTTKVACLAHTNNLDEGNFDLLNSPDKLKNTPIPFVAIPPHYLRANLLALRESRTSKSLGRRCFGIPILHLIL